MTARVGGVAGTMQWGVPPFPVIDKAKAAHGDGRGSDWGGGFENGGAGHWISS